jgi:G3E family GTPase
MLNGCICCNLVGSLSSALEELSTTADPDRIVIETSGSAFPATLAMEVNRLARESKEQTGEEKWLLDGVVSVVDVENWKGYEDTSYTARIQARFTDLIVFNKWEGCDERRFDECLDRVGDLEVDTAWVKSDKGWVDMNLVFGIDGGLAREMTGTEEAQDGHEHGEEGEHKHDHQSEVEVLSVTLEGESRDAAIDGGKLMEFLQKAPKEEVYRIKAVLDVDGYAVRNSDDDGKVPTESKNGRYILNWAFGRWTFTPLAQDIAEHESSEQMALRMTLILARYESTKWKKKIEAGGLLEMDGEGVGELTVTKIA